MAKLLKVNRKVILIACCLVLLFSAVALALNLKSKDQHLQGSSRKSKDEMIRQVEESPDQLLRILGNDDCPLRLVEAKVKEVPGPLFTELTGKTTRLATVSSVPEVKLVNTSGRTVTRFFLAIRDPKSQTTRSLIRSRISIKPGETFMLRREDFGGAERVTAADAAGRIRQTMVKPGTDSEKRWLEFAARPDLFATIAMVDFEDGSNWTIKEGGEVR